MNIFLLYPYLKLVDLIEEMHDRNRGKLDQIHNCPKCYIILREMILFLSEYLIEYKDKEQCLKEDYFYLAEYNKANFTSGEKNIEYRKIN